MFYERLEELCKEHGISPTAVTVQLGISKGTMSNWKKGATPGGDIIIKFAKHFNVSADYLLEIDKEECPSDEEEHLIQIFENEPETKAFFEMALSLTNDEKKDLVKLVKAWIAVQRSDDDNTN